MLVESLAYVGVFALVVLGTLLLMGIISELAKIHRVAKDYSKVIDESDCWADSNQLKQMNRRIGENTNRIYRAERRVDALEFHSLEHMDTFKHTKKRVVKK